MDHEVERLYAELETIDLWNARFGRAERNSDSYVARIRRRWEIVLTLARLGHQPSREDCALAESTASPTNPIVELVR